VYDDGTYAFATPVGPTRSDYAVTVSAQPTAPGPDLHNANGAWKSEHGGDIANVAVELEMPVPKRPKPSLGSVSGLAGQRPGREYDADNVSLPAIITVARHGPRQTALRVRSGGLTTSAVTGTAYSGEDSAQPTRPVEEMAFLPPGKKAPSAEFRRYRAAHRVRQPPSAHQT